jgi:phthiocerol/phenolphthiocerol synthesis type-I polyketide synthase D
VAVHRARTILKSQQAQVVVVGAVMLMLNPHTSVSTAAMAILSPLGRARPFDKSADGLVRGEACGGMVLQVASESVASRMEIRGSHTTIDNTALQLGQPDQIAEETVMLGALQSAKITNSQVVYTEMHGDQSAICAYC